MIRTTTGGRRSSAARWVVAVTSTGALAGLLAGCSFSGSVQDAGAATSAPSLSTPSASAPSASPSSASGVPSPSTSAPGDSSPSSTAGTGAASSPAGQSTGQSAGAAGGGGASGDSAACTTSDLALSLLPGEGGGSAGHQHYTIQFTNRGSTACTLDGHPGVSLVTGDSGQQLGAAASREGTPSLVRLGPGASAYADVSLAEAGNYDSSQCQPQAARGLRVYPPDQTASAFVPAQGLTGCASSSVVLLVVDPVVAGR